MMKGSEDGRYKSTPGPLHPFWSHGHGTHGTMSRVPVSDDESRRP